MGDHAALAGLRNWPVALARDHPQLPHNGPTACNPAGVTPRVFLSYSHDSEAHRAWVRLLAERLRRGGVDVTLDQWDLPYGADVVRFMDLGIRDADRVLMVCTANYVAKAEERKGGAGYEGMVVTGHVARATDTIKFVPIVRGNSGEPLVPGFLGQRLWLDFRDDGAFEARLEEGAAAGAAWGAALREAAPGAQSVCGGAATPGPAPPHGEHGPPAARGRAVAGGAPGGAGGGLRSGAGGGPEPPVDPDPGGGVSDGLARHRA
jgi:hypothetical protein